MKSVHQFLLPALLALAIPCFLAGQTPWVLEGNNNATATSFLGTLNAQPLRMGTQNANQPIRMFTGGIAAANERLTILSNGNVGIGSNSPSYRLHLLNSNNSRSGYLSNTFVSNSSTFGLYSETTNTGTGSEAAGFFRAQGTAGTNLGLDADARNGATNYGVRSTVVGTGTASSTNYGLYSSLTPSSTGNNYGIYSTLASGATGATNYSGYFNNGKVYIGYRLGIGLTAPLAALHVSGADNDGTQSAVRITSGSGATAQNLLLDGNEIDALTGGLYLNNNSSENVSLARGGGNVHIGDVFVSPDSSPSKLHVKGELRLQSPNNNSFRITTGDDGDLKFIGDNNTSVLTITDENNRVGIGTSAPVSALDVRGLLTVGNAGDNSIITMNAANGRTASIGVQDDNSTGFYVSTQGSYRLRVNQDGDIAIGAANVPAGYRLSVDGWVISEGVRVQSSNDWPDYVFESDYQLMPLAELEKSIAQNKRLPGMPGAEQVKAEGIDISETQRLLLQKVEELTLYIIELEKKVKILEQKKSN